VGSLDSSSSGLECLESQTGYRRLFSDPGFWRPYVQAVCSRHFQINACPVRAVPPGTYPTFIADDRWVVKFFGRLFDGQKSFEVEQEAGKLLLLASEIPAPRLVDQGALLEPGEPWSWPYLIFEYIPSASLREVYDELPPAEKEQIASDLGWITRCIHELSLGGSRIFKESWQGYAGFLERQTAGCQQKQQAWGSLPAHLIDQIGDYLLPPEELIDWSRKPHLIHADLTQDHLLGSWDGRRWQTRTLIDFGDARVGDLLYELAALHLDLFQLDTRLLGTFLSAYGGPLAVQTDFPRRALSTALLHEFDVFAGLSRRHPGIKEARSLAELAELIWVLGPTGS
jgi:aminoglycoside phosphotransferase (APT) family kinase protein